MRGGRASFSFCGQASRRGSRRVVLAHAGGLESILRVAYAGEWPQRLYGTLPRARRVDRIDLRLALLPVGSPPLRIGFVPDIHIGPTTSPRTIV